jgi:hypothetical protein
MSERHSRFNGPLCGERLEQQRKWQKSGVPCLMKAQTPKHHRQSFENLSCNPTINNRGAYDDEQNYTRFCTGYHCHCDEHSRFGKSKAGSYSFFLFFDFVRL